MNWKGCAWALMLLLLLVGAAHSMDGAVRAQQPPAAADDAYVPIDELPPDERLPAAPFLIAAYSAAWIIVALYLWSIWQRLGRVEREMRDVSRRVEQRSRGTAEPR